MSNSEENIQVEFNLPAAIKDFLFDLHDAVRRSTRMDEVQRLYDIKYKEITDKYFAQAPWPDNKAVVSEVGNDEDFLTIYREMTMRHVTTKLKPQLADHINSWKNYVQLFEMVLRTKEEDLCLTTQWVYDIIQEFVYQFQGFCQYRCQVANLASNPETIRVLEANRDAWNLPEVMSILRKLIRAAKTANPTGKSAPYNAGPFIVQFGYFAAIELSRLECLTGDFNASLAAVAHLKLADRGELLLQLPLCHFNVFYHTGVCNLMLRRFPAALDVLSDIVSHVARTLKPGAAGALRAGLQTQLQRQMDKAVALIVIASHLCPSYRLDETVREAVDAKFADKLQKLQSAETFHKTAADLFDFAAPKFISPAVPDYSVSANTRQEVPNLIQAAFMAELEQVQSSMKLRSFLGLYASIDVAKLARFNDTAEPELICQLLSLKNKSIQVRPAAAGVPATRVNTSDVHYFVDGGAIITDGASGKGEAGKGYERYFVAGVKKHVEIAGQLQRAFASAGLE